MQGGGWGQGYGAPPGPQGYGVPPGYGPPRPPPKKSMSGPVAALVAVVGVMVLGGTACAVCVAMSRKPSIEATAAPSVTSTVGEMPRTGEEGYINGPDDLAEYIVFPTKEALDAWEKAEGDKARAALLLGGFLVKRNIRVKVSSGSLQDLKIDILEGEMKGRSGWIAKGYVHRGKQ